MTTDERTGRRLRREIHARRARDLEESRGLVRTGDRFDAPRVFPTHPGMLYLAVILDVWSRRVIGWAMETHLRTTVVLAALDMDVDRIADCLRRSAARPHRYHRSADACVAHEPCRNLPRIRNVNLSMKPGQAQLRD